MPKNVENDKNKNNSDKIVSAEAGTSAPDASVTTIRSRRLGTGAIIGISAAGVALLAGAFGGGIALGAVTASHGPAGISHEMDQAGSRMPGHQMRDGQMREGQMPGGQKQRGQMPEGPGMPPLEPGAQGMKMIPGVTPGQSAPTAAPIPTN